VNEPSFSCSLTDEGLRARLEEWLGLDERALLRAEDRPNGRLHVYQASEEVERVIAAPRPVPRLLVRRSLRPGPGPWKYRAGRPFAEP
jgi:hypothetical protein